ncbi:hypothetical protein D3C75_864370 [compost metagenome]
MGLDNPLADHQPKTCSCLLIRKERLTQLRQHILRDSLAFVREYNDNRILIHLLLNGDCATFGHSFNCIFNDIYKYLLQLVLLTMYHCRLLREL